jgi:pullulanase
MTMSLMGSIMTEARFVAGGEYAAPRSARHSALRPARFWVVAFVCSALGSPFIRAEEAPAASLERWRRAGCDATEVASTPRPIADGASDARGYWLDRRHLRWPGAAPGRYRLYASANGRMRAQTGTAITGADQGFDLAPSGPLPPALSERFAFTGAGVDLALADADATRLPELLRSQLLLVRENAQGRVLEATRLQLPGALDALYADAEEVPDLGVTVTEGATQWKLWAPTARMVTLCLYRDGISPATSVEPMRRDDATGTWSLRLPRDLSGGYYTYLVEVHVPGASMVRNRVTDPYSVSLAADSTRSFITSLDASVTKPPGWDAASRPDPLSAPTDMAIYELHVRDFSRDDPSVSASQRGKYLAFTEAGSHGMRHLRGLRRAGMTDVHLLPVFDIASVPERDCSTPRIPDAAPDSEVQQAAVARVAASDCYNWGYDPLHFNAPEGSYASDPGDGATRIREFRAMVQALHAAGLRVGMDVVYNHTSASGQDPKSVLDRIVPGYYHRLDAKGVVERSTCCDNTATEHRMMGKLMRDSVALWAKHYRIDSFRFDLMGHQPRAEMERLQHEVDASAGRHVDLIGEGWNFGEIAGGKRFVQASQLSLNGSGIGTFSDRARDAIRGGGPADHGEALFVPGYVNGLADLPFDSAPAALRSEPAPDLIRGQTVEVKEAEGETPVRPERSGTSVPRSRRERSGTSVPRSRRERSAEGAKSKDVLHAKPSNELLHAADLVRVGLAGSLRDYRMTDAQGRRVTLAGIDYKGQPAGYVSEPGEVVNYVENHDNQTLFDINVWKLPQDTSRTDRARVQLLALALNAFSQGIAYFHAGGELLRSKSLDRNSFDSGDWFNRIDWSGRDNFYGTGLPPKPDNGEDWPLMRPLLADGGIKPAPADIAFTRDAFNDLLRIRASSTLFRMRTAADIRRRLSFPNSGPEQNPLVIAGHLDGAGYPQAAFREILYLVNVSSDAQTLTLPDQASKRYMLHPVQRSPSAADARARREAQYDPRTGRFVVPARTAVVYVVP